LTAPFDYVDLLLDIVFGGVIIAILVPYVRRKLPLWVAKTPLSEGKYDEALRRLTLLKRLHITSPNLLHMTGTVLMFAGRDREAEEVIRQCLARALSPPERGLFLVNLGYVLLGEKRYDEAQQVYEEAIRNRPNGAVAYSSLAEVYLQQGIQPEKALQLVDLGIKFKRASPIQAGVDQHILGYLFANRAWALFLLGRTEEARESLEEARQFGNVQSKPGAAGVHYHIARALLAGGLNDEAARHLRQVKQIDPQGRYAALADSFRSQ
jgi:tetratricopeptide (TPR) repeat protein